MRSNGETHDTETHPAHIIISLFRALFIQCSERETSLQSRHEHRFIVYIYNYRIIEQRRTSWKFRRKHCDIITIAQIIKYKPPAGNWGNIKRQFGKKWCMIQKTELIKCRFWLNKTPDHLHLRATNPRWSTSLSLVCQTATSESSRWPQLSATRGKEMERRTFGPLCCKHHFSSR